jgi:hypothetical protein
MPRLRILDLDGSVSAQTDRLSGLSFEAIDARAWGPRIRLACSFRAFGRFRRWLGETALSPGRLEAGGGPAEPIAPASVPGGEGLHRAADGALVTLYGSGDFHHVTLALLERLDEPFNLLVLDKHPDWMRAIPFLHCGTWLSHALGLPNLRRVFHCGGELDFDNGYRFLAPWHELSSGRIVVFPARRRFARGRWRTIRTEPLLRVDRALGETLSTLLDPYRPELAACPLYVTIDKDVLAAEDASVNWDSGLLRLADVLTILQAFLDASGGRLAGADLLGDWSPVVLGNRLARLCHRLDHPGPEHDPADAAARNADANAAIVRCILDSSR